MIGAEESFSVIPSLHSPSVFLCDELWSQLIINRLITFKTNKYREISLVLCDHLEGWVREGGREMQEGGDMGIYVYV